MMTHREFRAWLLLVCSLLAAILVEGVAEAAYRPAVAVQDEAAITCGTPTERIEALQVAQDLGATRIRVNAVENMNPVFGCDPVAAARLVAAGGLQPYVTVVGSPAYAKKLARTIGPIVNQWSVWNEVNIEGWQIGHMAHSKGPSSYRKLYIRMERVLRKYDPGSRVLIGELAPIKDAWFISQVAKRGGRPIRSDGIAVHAYIWTTAPESKHSSGLRGYLTAWRRAARRWARERRLCLPRRGGNALLTTRGRRVCRPVPIYISESGYLRQARGDHVIFSSAETANRLVRMWRVACHQKVRQMFHYQLLDNRQPEWDTALYGEWGPRPEFEALKGYIRNAKGCKGSAGRLGPTFGPPIVPFVPEHPQPLALQLLARSPVDALGPEVPDDVPVVVEPEPQPAAGPVVEPEPVVEEPAVVEPEPVVEEPTPPVDAAEES